MAALMSCTIPCVFCCISRNFAFGGKSVTLVMDHGTMSHLMGECWRAGHLLFFFFFTIPHLCRFLPSPSPNNLSLTRSG